MATWPLWLLVVLGPLAVRAAVVDKADNTNVLSATNSWVGGVLPGTNDIARWTSVVTGSNQVASGTGVSLLGMRVVNPGGPVVLTGTGVVSLGASGLDLATATQDLTWQGPVRLTAGQTWNVTNGRVVRIQGNVTNTGSMIWAKVGNGRVQVNGGLTYGDRLNNNGLFEITGGTLNVDWFTAGYYGSGTTLVTGGVLRGRTYIMGAYGAGGVGGVITITGAAQVVTTELRINQANNATINLDGGTLTIARAVNSGGTSTFRFNGGRLVASASTATFFSANIVTTVNTGPARIDTGVYDITIPAPILHLGTLGATPDGGLVKSGSGVLTLTSTNNYSGPTTISNGTLTVNGRLNGTGLVTVVSGGTLGGTGVINGAVTVLDGGTLDTLAGRLTVGGLTLGSNSVWKVGLGSGVSSNTARLQVNGHLVLDGQVLVSNTGGLTNGSVFSAFAYTGTFTNRGLEMHPQSGADFTVDTNTPGVVKLVVAEVFDFLTINGGDRDVLTTSTNLSVQISGITTNPVWYEVREQSGRLRDFGAHAPSSPWTFNVRHLREGTNTVTVFARPTTGGIASTSAKLVMTLPEDPENRPRPYPAEMWWGGTCHDNITNGSGSIIGTTARISQLGDPGLDWDFVKEHQDGFLLHGYVWVNNAARMTNFATFGTNLAAQLEPYRTRFWLENAWRPVSNNMNYGVSSASGHAGDDNELMGVGLVTSEITQDYNPLIADFCSLNPTWPKPDLMAQGTGDLTDVSTNYPYASGQWMDYVTNFKSLRPHIQVGWTWSPVWFGWSNGASLGTNHLAFITTVGGTNYPFFFDFKDFMVSGIRVGTNQNRPFAFASDCPWDYFGDPSNPGGWSAATQAANRKKIRDYEAWLQLQGLRHTLICNESSAGTAFTTAYDAAFKTNSLKSMWTHQAEGGRADRYLFESWYGGPYVMGPETNPTTYTSLARDAIRYLKGVRDDVSGTNEWQTLGVGLSTNGVRFTNVTLTITNTGDYECMPCFTAVTGGSAGFAFTFLSAAGSNITAAITSANGWTYTNRLQPGASTTIRCIAALTNGATVAVSDVRVEAFWNPQDPTGRVRNRTRWTTFTTLPTLAWTNSSTVGTNLWSAGANWAGGVAPLAGTNYILSFFSTVPAAGSGSILSVNDLGTYDVNQLNLAGTGSVSGATTVLLEGAPLRLVPFVSAGPEINLTAMRSGTNEFLYHVDLPIELTTNVVVQGSGNATFQFEGELSGPGGLRKLGTSTLTLTGTNTFTGSLGVFGGGLSVDSDGALGAVPDVPSDDLVFGASSTFRALDSFLMELTRGVVISNGVTATFAAGTGVVWTVAGDVSGGGVLSKSDSGTVVLSGSNSFSGGVIVGTGANGSSSSTGGRLVAAVDGALGTGPVTMNGGANTTDTNAVPVLVLTNGIALDNAITFTSARNGNPDVGVAHVRSFGDNELSGVLALQNGGGNGVNIESVTGLLTVSGRFTNTAVSAIGARPLVLWGAGDFLISGPLENNGTNAIASLWKYGTGTASLTSSNDFTGGVTVSNGVLAVNGYLGTGGTVTVQAPLGVLSGTGVIATATLIGGTHRPSGVQTFRGTLAYPATGRLAWELFADTNAGAGVNFDQVATTNLSVTAGAAVNLVFNSPGSTVNFSNVFWSVPRSWTIVSGTAGSGSFALGTVSTDSLGQSSAGLGAFSVTSGGGAVTVNWTPTPSTTVWVTASTPAASEAGPTAGAFTVWRSGGTNAAVSVNYGVSGTATPGSDYTALPGSVAMAAGQTSAVVTVTVLGDATYEPAETVGLALLAGTNYLLGAPTNATVTIANASAPPVASISASDAVAAELGPDPGVFTVTLSPASALPATVNLAWQGAASNGSDYAALPASVVFAAGQTSTNLVVTPLPDGIVEGDESVLAILTGGTDCTVGVSSNATVVIEDSPQVSVTATVPWGSESGPSNAVFTVTRTGSGLGALTVSYVAGGSATPGTDYAALPGAITFSGGQTSTNLVVTPVADALLETNESVVVTLVEGTNYALAAPTNATAWITSAAGIGVFTNTATGTVLPWATGGNWLGGIAPSAGSNTALEFFPGITNLSAGPVVASNDVTAPFVLNTLTLAGTSGAGVTGSVSLVGGSLSLATGAAGAPGLVLAAGSGSGSVSYVLAMPVSLDATASVRGSGNGAFVLAGPVSGSGGMIKTGNAALYLAGTNTYAGPTVISNGTLFVGNGGTTGTLGQGPVTNNGTLAFRRTDTGLVVSNQITGSGGLYVAGAFGSEVTLTSSNSFTGGVNLSTGAVRILSGFAFGTNAKTVVLVNGSTGRPGVRLDGGGGPVWVPGYISFQTSSTDTNDPAFRNEAGTNLIAGRLSLAAGGGSTRVVSAAGHLTLSGLIASSAAGRILQLDGPADGEVSGPIVVTTNSPGVSKDGAGTWTLSGTNNYSGGTAVNAGTLLVNGTLATGGVLSVASGAVLGGTGTIATTTLVAGTHQPGANGVGEQTFSGTVTYAAGGRLAWQLGLNSTGSTVRVAAGAVVASNGAAVNLVMNGAGSAVVFSNAFWSTNRSWVVLTGTNVTGGFGLGTVSVDSAGQSHTNRGVFAVTNTATNVVVVWTANVAPVLSGYEQWQATNFGANATNAAVAGELADPDGDGVGNLLEYAFGMNPLACNLSHLPYGVYDGGSLSLYYTQVNAATDIVYEVQWANDLMVWSTSGVSQTVLTNNGVTRWVQAAVSATNEPSKFLRVKILKP